MAGTDSRRAACDRWMVTVALTVLWLATSGAQSPLRRSQWDGIYSDTQARRGQALYAVHCARCHGVDLGGVVQPVHYPGQPAMTPSLTGREFLAHWSGMTMADLAERTRISMPQNNPGVLPRREVADLLAYLWQASGYPSGATDLPADVASLSTLDIRLTP